MTTLKPIDAFFYEIYNLENYDQIDLINAIYAWSKENDWFDTSFCKKLETMILSNKKLSHKQTRAIINIIIKNDIMVENYIKGKGPE